MVTEIEIDGPANDALRFRPLQRNVRGRFDWQRCADPESHRAASQWGGIAIPGQVIGFDDERGAGYVREPLHDALHGALREKIAKRGLQLPPEREEFAAQDRETWLFWMRQSVACGLARVISERERSARVRAMRRAGRRQAGRDEVLLASMHVGR